MESEQRLHPLSLLFSVGTGASRWLIPGLLVLLAARSGGIDAWLMLLFVPYAAFSLVRYLGFRYCFTADELVVRTGFIFRNERHIRYARIHNIESVQNPLHRLFAVADVRVETGSGQEPEARLQVLSVRAMEEVRRRVSEGKRQGAAAGEAVGSGPASPETSEARRSGEAPEAQARTLLRLPLREVVLHGIISNRGMVVVAAVLGAAWEFGLFNGGRSTGALPFGRTAIDLPDLKPLLGASILLLALKLALLLVVFLVLLRLLSIGWAVVKLHDFTLRRAGRDLRSACGLLTRLHTTIPLHRIQLLTFRETPGHRLFGRMAVKVETAGGGGEEEAIVSRRWLAPLIRREDAPGLLREVMPEVDLNAVTWRPVDPRARRRVLRRWLLITALAALGCSQMAGWWALSVLAPLLPLSWLNARLQASHLRYALADGAILFRSGWVWRNLSVARYSKVQAIALCQSPFDRRYGMARLRVDTAGAGSASHRIDIPYLDQKIARQALEHLVASAARTEFRW